MAEQFLHSGGVELVDALKILGMNAPGHEQAIDPESVRARQIGAYRIADSQNALQLDWMLLAIGGQLYGTLIDRPVRLAIKDHLTAEFAMELCDSTGAIDQA